MSEGDRVVDHGLVCHKRGRVGISICAQWDSLRKWSGWVCSSRDYPTVVYSVILIGRDKGLSGRSVRGIHASVDQRID